MRRPEEELVLACLSVDSGVSLRIAKFLSADLDWNIIRAIAVRHRVGPFLHEVLSKNQGSLIPSSVLNDLHIASRLTAARNAAIQKTVPRLLDEFEQACVPVVLLKGAAVLNTVYSSAPHLRYCLDIDILLHQAHLARADAILKQLGYESSEDFPANSQKSYQLPIYLRPGDPVGIEVHIGLIKNTSPFRIAVGELWDRADLISVDGRRMRVFAPEDMILHSALHMSFHKEFAAHLLRPLRDIAAMAVTTSLDWSALSARAYRYRAERPVYYALTLARGLLGAPVPDDVLSSLGSRIGRWERLLFEQLAQERNFLTGRDPLRLLLQITLLQIAGYQKRWGFLRALLRHPLALSPATKRLLSPELRVSTIRPKHLVLACQLTAKGLSVGFDLLRRGSVPSRLRRGPLDASMRTYGHEAKASR